MIRFYGQVAKKEKMYPEIIRRLRTLLHEEEPEVIYFLSKTWKNQKNAITYADLRKAIIAGELDKKILNQWNEEYAVFVNKKLVPKWEKAMTVGAEEIKKGRSHFVFDISYNETKAWVKKYSGNLITQLSEEQRKAVNAMLQRVTKMEGTPDVLAMQLRPLIGLNERQATANLNYYSKVRETFLNKNPNMKLETVERKAKEAAAKYAEKQHRGRAMTISRTELAKAYHAGEYYGMKQAQADGMMGKLMKEVVTAGVDVCPGCRDLEGTQIDLDASFETQWGSALFSPFHPCCRCCVEYVEIERPRFMVE